MRRISGYLIAYLAIVMLVLVISLLRADTLHEGVRTFATLLFFVGAFIAGLGAFTYVGQSRPGFAEWYGHSAGRGDQVKIFLEYRERQRKSGKAIIIFGVALIASSIAIGWPVEAFLGQPPTGAPSAMLTVTAEAQGDQDVKLTIEHEVGDDLAVADLEIRASKSAGIATFDFPSEGTFSAGDTTTATYTYGPDPQGKVITVQIIHVPSNQRIFSSSDIFVWAA